MLGECTTGIGRYTLEIVRGIDRLAATRQFSYSLLVPRKHCDRPGLLAGFRHCGGVTPLGSLAKNAAHQILKRRLPLSIDSILPRGAYFFPAYTMLPMRSRASAVVIHDLAHLEVPDCVEAGNARLLDYALPRSVKQAGAIITISEYTKQRLLHHFGIEPSRIRIAPPAVDRHVYRRIDHATSRSVRERYGITCENYLLAVGTLEPRKNLARVIDAFSLLPEPVRQQYSLVLIGANGWDKGETQARIGQAQAKGIRILRPRGYVQDDDMAAFYSGAQGLVFLPLYEGFGIPPLEAYACDTPVLASRVSSVPEAAGDMALYVDDPKDLDAIRRGMLELLAIDEPRREALQPSMRRHLDSFGWLQSAATTVDALTGLCADSLMRAVSSRPEQTPDIAHA